MFLMTIVNEFSYYQCQCGAITICVDGKDYSCLKKNIKKFFPNIDLRKGSKLNQTYCCDHCVNHYGLDLCACGSGETPQKCTNEYSCCGYPHQVMHESFDTYNFTHDLPTCLKNLGFENFPETKEDVKKKYRKLAAKFHPDVKGSKEDFQNLKDNYDAALALF